MRPSGARRHWGWPLLDRLSFLASRFLGPLNNLAILWAIALAFGKPGVADYTFAMAFTAPVYFLVGFSLPAYVAVQPGAEARRPEVFWVRILTVGVSCLVAMLALLAGAHKWAVVSALWFLKAGDLLFEPVTVFAATDVAGGARGRRLMVFELVRAGLIQMVLWGVARGVKATLVTTLALVGLASLTMGTLLLARAPGWSGFGWDGRAVWERMKAMAVTCTPMTASGAILATLIGLPRLLLDGSLSQDERTLMGLAQVAGSVLALVFNALWMYELHRLKQACEALDYLGVRRHNTVLSLVFFAVLGLACGAVWLAPHVLPLKYQLLKANAGPLAGLILVLCIPHCLSLHRDALKLVGEAWLEVRILVAATVASLLAGWLGHQWLGAPWWAVALLMVLVSAAIQLALALWGLKRAFRRKGEGQA